MLHKKAFNSKISNTRKRTKHIFKNLKNSAFGTAVVYTSNKAGTCRTVDDE